MKYRQPLAFLSILPLLASCSLIEDSAVDDITDDGADAFAKVPTLINIDDPAAVSDLFEIVLDASYIALQAHIEVQASWKHDLQGISNGEEVAAPTDNVGETIDACVEVAKALDQQDGEELLLLDLSYALCAEGGRAGGLDIRSWLHEATVTDPAPDDPASDPLVVQPSSMELILSGYKQGSLRFDGVVNWEGVSDAAAGIFRYEEDGAYTVEVDVANALGSNDLAVAIPLQVTQVVSGGIDASGVFAATGTAVVEAQGRTADLTFFLSSSPEACPDGGLSGKIVITRDGASREVPLNCWDAAGKAGLYNTKQYDMLRYSNGASCVGCDLSLADLSGGRFAGYNLSSANLSGATLGWSSDFTGAKFIEAELGKEFLGSGVLGLQYQSTNLAGDFSNANFKSSGLDRANLTGRFSGANFSGAYANYLNVSPGISCRNFSASYIPMMGADFGGVYLHYAKFECVDLGSANFVDAIFNETTFFLSNLENAVFRHEFGGAIFDLVICPDGFFNGDDEDLAAAKSCEGHMVPAP